MPDLWWIYTSNREPGYFDSGFMSKVSPQGVPATLFICMSIFRPCYGCFVSSGFILHHPSAGDGTYWLATKKIVSAYSGAEGAVFMCNV